MDHPILKLRTNELPNDFTSSSKEKYRKQKIEKNIILFLFITCKLYSKICKNYFVFQASLSSYKIKKIILSYHYHSFLHVWVHCDYFLFTRENKEDKLLNLGIGKIHPV